LLPAPGKMLSDRTVISDQLKSAFPSFHSPRHERA
jgi:hypothetical protein